MAFELFYHPVVTGDLTDLDKKLKRRIQTAIEQRLTTAPHQYGEPLRKTLKGYWKLRVSDYRVVFKVVEQEVCVFGIIHRKDVYERIARRTARSEVNQK